MALWVDAAAQRSKRPSSFRRYLFSAITAVPPGPAEEHKPGIEE